MGQDLEHREVSAILLWPHPYTTTTFLLIFSLQEGFLPHISHWLTALLALPCPGTSPERSGQAGSTGSTFSQAPGTKPCKAQVLRAILQVLTGTARPPALQLLREAAPQPTAALCSEWGSTMSS